MTRGTYLLQIPWELDAIGGVSQVVRNLAITLHQPATHRAAVFISDWSASRLQRQILAEPAGLELIRYRLRSPVMAAHPGRALLAYLSTAPATIATLRGLLSSLNAQAVNVHYPGDNAWLWVVMKRIGLLRVPLVLSFHGQDLTSMEQATGASRWLWNDLLRGADALVFCSEALRDRLARCSPSCRIPKFVIHNGCDPQAIRTAAEQHASPLLARNGRSYLLSLGTFEHKKGHDILLQAFARLAPRHAGLDLVIAGRAADRQYIESLQAQIAARDLSERVQLLMDVPHGPAMALLRNAAVLVLPSRIEPFGIVALEAAVLGRPVIVSDACGVCEAVPSDALVRFRKEDSVELAERIDSLLADPVASGALAARLEAFVASNLTWRSVAQRYCALIEDLSRP